MEINSSNDKLAEENDNLHKVILINRNSFYL